eukprot:TRINITY_DN5978_c0_g1_i1.p1 TRINITY_DN5978_c0_g1~~TRINITY_DN5978_c0_g1_i1.p1  ORF type:complete len:308 (+),score=58.10 TRINITY_DN5978_c0_g1_i1:29-952(+)
MHPSQTWLEKTGKYATWQGVLKHAHVSYDEFLEKWDGTGSVADAAEKMGYTRLEAAKIEAQWSRRGQLMIQDSDKWKALQAVLVEYNWKGTLVAANQCEKETSERGARFRERWAGQRTVLTLVNAKSQEKGIFDAVPLQVKPGRYVISLYEVCLGVIRSDASMEHDTLYNRDENTYTVHDSSRYIERYKCMVQVDNPPSCEPPTRAAIRDITNTAINVCSKIASAREQVTDMIDAFERFHQPPLSAMPVVDPFALTAHCELETNRLASLEKEGYEGSNVSVTMLAVHKKALENPYSVMWVSPHSASY